MSISKPRVTPVSASYFRVSYRALEGALRQEGPYNWSAIYIPANAVTNTRLARRCSTGQDALEALLLRLDEIADCRESLVAADTFETCGGRDRIAKLGSTEALAAFDAAKQQLMQDDASGLALVRGMMKAANKKRLPSAETLIVTFEWRQNKTAGVTIVPGFSVAITNGPTYFIGGTAEHGSYNQHYFGQITSITTKTVTIAPSSGNKNKRLKLVSFVASNTATVASKVESNIETSYSI